MLFRDKIEPKILMVFVFGGLFGFIYEEIFYRIDLGYFVKRGTTFGPWIPIYGFGAVAIILLARRFVEKPWKVFLASVFISGVLEFATGYVLFHGLGVRLWDYNVEIWNWGNIGGYICLRSVLFFGVSALALHYAVYPIFEKITERVSERVLITISIVPAALFSLDILATVIRAIFYIR